MVSEKPREYVCDTCHCFESTDEDEVIEHEKILVQDMGIGGLILKDLQDEYHVFIDAKVMDEDHIVFYGVSMVCPPKEPVLSIAQEAAGMDFADKAVMPFSKPEKHTAEDVIRRRKERSGWEIPENPTGTLYGHKDIVQGLINRHGLVELADLEFLHIAKNIREANPGKYDGFKFQQQIPESLK